MDEQEYNLRRDNIEKEYNADRLRCAKTQRAVNILVVAINLVTLFLLVWFIW